jgi:hypothetical protein
VHLTNLAWHNTALSAASSGPIPGLPPRILPADIPSALGRSATQCVRTVFDQAGGSTAATHRTAAAALLYPYSSPRLRGYMSWEGPPSRYTGGGGRNTVTLCASIIPIVFNSVSAALDCIQGIPSLDIPSAWSALQHFV